MVNRWENRADPRPGQEVLYWHILLKSYSGLLATVRASQEKLALFRGLHLTPQEWAHITTYVAGPREEVSRAALERMIERAAESLDRVAPITVNLSRVLYHPEAIVLKVDPSGVLDPVRVAVKTASNEAGLKGDSGGEQSWAPHVTLAYSTAFQSASPIIRALGRQVPGCQATIDRISLVAQRGPERAWDWHPVIHIPLGGVEISSEQDASNCPIG